MKTSLFFFFLIFTLLISFSSAQQCGLHAREALCPNGLCCSNWGYCGSSEDYCKPSNCQSQCTHGGPPPIPTSSLSDIITQSMFEDMFKHRNDAHCSAKDLYTYDGFMIAARYFPAFGNTGDDDTREKEVAAFLGQTAHETTGGWPTAPGGPYAWGYCLKEERSTDYKYCSDEAPCLGSYHGRGPMMLSWNYNYQKCGEAIGEDLLNNPDLVSKDTVIAFKSAIWYWMTPQSSTPSCHDVITNQWKPSLLDIVSGRFPGYGVTTNIINGGIECGFGYNPAVKDRTGFYKRFCEMLGVNPGENLDCYHQRPFGIFFPDSTV